MRVRPTVIKTWLSVVSLVGLLALETTSTAQADPPSAPAVAGAPPTVTIEAQRQLRREVNKFVEATVVRPREDQSLLRWDSPVCPLVAGLTRAQGEFVLARLSTIAHDADVPLASEKCEANLYVIVARNPGGFLWLWWQHDRRLFNTTHGVAGVKHFIETARPVRVWYNSTPMDPDSSSEIATLLAQSVGIGVGGGPQSLPINMTPALGSRLTYAAVRGIASVIVVIDAEKLANLSFGQLADYVALRALVEINPDTDAGGAPTILSLFDPANSSPPPGLSAWDKALLHAVYASKQKDRVQLSEIESVTLKDLIAVAAH
jgi:hypothetical protein